MKCSKCGQEIKITQPTMVLSIGRLPSDFVFTALSCDDASGSYHQLGQEFRKWWSGHVASGFADGFFGIKQP